MKVAAGGCTLSGGSPNREVLPSSGGPTAEFREWGVGVNLIKQFERVSSLHLFFMSIFFLVGGVAFLDIATANWSVATLQATLFAVLAWRCIQQFVTGPQGWMVFLPFCAIFVCVLTYAGLYTRIGLLHAGSTTVFYPAWDEALYFSVITFTTLGYGDLVSRDEFRFVAAGQAVFGYLYFGALVATVAADFIPRRGDGARSRGRTRPTR